MSKNNYSRREFVITKFIGRSIGAVVAMGVAPIAFG